MNLLSRYVAWTERLLENKLFLKLFILINVLGFAVGVWTYSRTMAETNPLLWIVLVDCPIYVALMAFLLALRKNRFMEKFSFLVFYGIIKYGFWTLVAWGLYYKEFLMVNTPVNGIIFVSHVGMILEAGFVARRASQSKGLEIALPIIWMFASDFFDYLLGTHPPLPDSNYLSLLLAQNIMLNILIPVFLFFFLRKSLEKSA
jgi:uncharacterized membrane protein YpjA